MDYCGNAAQRPHSARRVWKRISADPAKYTISARRIARMNRSMNWISRKRRQNDRVLSLACRRPKKAKPEQEYELRRAAAQRRSADLRDKFTIQSAKTERRRPRERASGDLATVQEVRVLVGGGSALRDSWNYAFRNRQGYDNYRCRNERIGGSISAKPAE